MAKTLSESAAEILNASIGKNQEPQQKQGAEVEDLGGATNENPGGDAVGSAAAANVGEAPKPAVKSAPQEPMGGVKSQGLAKPVVGSVQPDYDGGGSASESVEVEGDVIAEQEEETSEEIAAEEQMTVDEIAEAKKQWIKEKIADRKGSMVQDVDALFNGESLSEEFRGKATVIFEAAVMSRVETILEDVLADNDQVLEEAVGSIKTELSEQVDEYLNYVVEQWMEENQVAVETGIRAELVNDFIGGLKNLFAEHYIEIPDDKVDVAEELAQRVIDLEEAAAARDAEFAAISEELNTAKKAKLIGLACEGLTQVQASKMKSLAEGVEFTTEGDFNNKLAVIRESYFPTKVQVNSEVKKVIQETSEDQPEVAEVSGLMSHYVKAITKTAPKF